MNLRLGGSGGNLAAPADSSISSASTAGRCDFLTTLRPGETVDMLFCAVASRHGASARLPVPQLLVVVVVVVVHLTYPVELRFRQWGRGAARRSAVWRWSRSRDAAVEAGGLVPAVVGDRSRAAGSRERELPSPRGLPRSKGTARLRSQVGPRRGPGRSYMLRRSSRVFCRIFSRADSSRVSRISWYS